MKIKLTNLLFLKRKVFIKLIMRTFIFLFCVTALSFTPKDLLSQNSKIIIEIERLVTVDEVFEIITEQTEYSFIYPASMFKGYPRVKLKKGTIKANKLLEKSLSKGQFTFNFTKNNTIIIEEEEYVVDQKKTITGRVTDNEGLPLPGVIVSIEETTKGVQTDFDGRYSISASKGQTLIFTYVGLKSSRYKIGDELVINVKMEIANNLEEVFIVAYGTAKKSSFTGSVSTIKAEEIEDRPITNVIQSLEGTVAGLQTSLSNGRPGSAPSVVIRGVGTAREDNGANAPLYVVDGFVYDLPPDVISNLDQFNILSSLDPANIESISVLKDASAASLYGARAANGVIIITTKKGKGKPKFNFRIQQGTISQATSLARTLGKPQYYELMWEGLKNELSHSNPSTAAASLATENLISRLGYNVYNVANNKLVSNQGVFNPNANLLYNDFDWWDELARPAIRTNIGGDISAGNDKSDYFISLGYTKDEGYVLNSKLERYSARINTNSQILDWLKIGVNLNANHRIGVGDAITNSQRTGNPIVFAAQIGPIYPVHLYHPTTGNLILDKLGNPAFDFGESNEYNTGLYPDRPYGAGNHPLAENILNSQSSANTIASGRSNIDITFFEGFKLRNGIGIDIYNLLEEAFNYSVLPEEREAQRSHYNQIGLTLNQILTYNRKFGNHTVDATLGHESFSNTGKSFSSHIVDQIFEGNDEFSNFKGTPSISGQLSERALESYFSRLNYEFNDTYFMSLSYRRDGTSILYKDERWGDFYSIGLGWLISNESFMDKSNWLNSLKLRLSHGTSGNLAGLSDYQWQATYISLDNAFETGYTPFSPGGKELVWEGQKLTDIGLDFSLFKNKVSGTIDYYNKDSDDLIFQVPQAGSLGVRFEELPKNIGKINNKGLEIQLEGDILTNENFNWNLNINATIQNTKMVELSKGEDVDLGSRRLSEGHDFFEWYLFDYVGVNEANGDPLFRGLKEGAYNPARDIIIANDTLTPSISSAKRHFTGKSSTPDVFGGITNTFRYKNFSLTTLITYQIGGYMINGSYQTLMNPDYGEAAHVDLRNAWKTPGDVTNVPRYDPTNLTNTIAGGSTRWLTSRTQMSLRRISLKYQFSKGIIDALNASNGSLYVSGENLAIFSKQKGLNASTINQGIATFQPSKIISLGFNIGF